MTNTPFRFTAPPSPRSATGTVARVYEQIAADFGLAEPATFVVLASAPELLVPAWALLRESLIAGAGSRAERELVALGVSQANECPFCVDAHTMFLHATGDHALAERVQRGKNPRTSAYESLLTWARTTRRPAPAPPALLPSPSPSSSAPSSSPAPSSSEAPFPFAPERVPAYLGTALTFHFVNRIVSSLLTGKLLPGNAERLRPVRSLAGRSLGGRVRREHVPGASLALLDDAGPGPAWAAGDPVGPAYAALRAAAHRGADLLDPADRRLARESVAAWDGGHPPLTPDPFPARTERPGARLAVLSALAPYRITDEDVTAWRGPGRTDADLVRLVAYGAFLAVDRIEETLGRRAAGASQAADPVSTPSTTSAASTPSTAPTTSAAPTTSTAPTAAGAPGGSGAP